jgi:hypothetical protein
MPVVIYAIQPIALNATILMHTRLIPIPAFASAILASTETGLIVRRVVTSVMLAIRPTV